MLEEITLDISELNEQQKEALMRPCNTFTRIAAGAGTGKTKIISKRFVKLVNDLKKQGIENPIERILVITFTQKAAAEMKNRIFKELKTSNKNYSDGEDWISTIHGFCSRILKKHSIEAGLSASFELCDDKKAREIYDRIVEKVIYLETSSISYINEILAELGLDSEILSGQNLLKLSNIANLNDIFNDIYEIIKKIKSAGLTPKEFMKESIIAQEQFSAVSKSLNIGFQTIEEYYDDWFSALKKYSDVSCKLNEDTFKNLTSEGVIIDKNGARGKNSHLKWSYAQEYPENVDEINEVEIYLAKIITVIYSIYEKEFEQNDLVDYDDLINKTLYIFENNEIIREYYKKFFKHIIVDEFQDTSSAQMKLVLSLLSDDAPDLTVVGDRKQSIYGFRYARMENLDTIGRIIEKKYNQKYDAITLENNYRCAPFVLDAVNYVTQNEIGLNETLKVGVQRKFADENEGFKITKIDGFKNALDYSSQEGKFIASEIIRIKKKEGLDFKDFAVLVKGHAQADAIEYVLSSYGIPAVKKVSSGYFRKEVIKNILALFGFLSDLRNENALVKILEFYFSQKQIYKLKKAMDNFLYANLEKEEIEGMNFAQKIIFVYEKNSFEALQIDDEIKIVLKKLVSALLEITKNKKVLALDEIFYKLMDLIKITDINSSMNENLIKIDLLIFERIIYDYVKKQNYVTIKNFLEYIDVIKDDKSYELPQVTTDNLNAVQVLTIHASKGLEFPYVFTAGLKSAKDNYKQYISFELSEEEKFGIVIHEFRGKTSPKYKIFKEIYQVPRQKSEEIRLFYVALSRAVDYLHVITFEKYSNVRPASYLEEFTQAFSNKISCVNPLELVTEKLPKRKVCIKDDVIRIEKNIKQRDVIFTVSFSKINTFNHCAQKFLYKYVYGYPENAQKLENSLVGTVVHNFICNSFINKSANIEDIIEGLLKSLSLKEEEKKRVEGIINTFVKSRFWELSYKKVLCEYGFEFVYEGMKFQGDIDLIIKNSDGSVDIIDFKTNKNIENSLNDYYKQMFIYKKALESQNFKIRKVIIANLKPEEISEIVLEKNDFERAERAIDCDLEKIKELLYSKTATAEYNRQCENCGFSYLCQNQNL